MAKNDWIVAGLNNPDFTSYDFSNIADMNLDNTQMLSADEYLKSDFIRNNDLFKNRKERGGELVVTYATIVLGVAFFVLCIIL